MGLKVLHGLAMLWSTTHALADKLSEADACVEDLWSRTSECRKTCPQVQETRFALPADCTDCMCLASLQILSFELDSCCQKEGAPLECDDEEHKAFTRAIGRARTSNKCSPDQVTELLMEREERQEPVREL
eukprot:CAMPEP_0171103790 /NCGR_PEP_ID=MMETSP0766_2-20121228/59391_1 /TAXON_ID=439317 /ORGANISM="Gambierdiscus australes, Strain CAWD 149" /LENGTH=130 /DNA_ID=CAMNT_0011564281 /DNA_START=57 /DNA_END=449 /DNA_ORIENTATION=-